jgi:2,3-bisphosphoglycerate-dependent phosphoglycerate mutase|tara:strand:- start:2728 stop:3465 length:738 start_codon:yes stop_codon:yes gene_type:complete
MKLILLRHGESEWNFLNQFTGWTDVDLTKNGIQEAQFSAKQILKENIILNTLYTSILVRSTHTAEIIADMITFNKENIQYDWRLNERHYGALQGLNKSETASKYGEEQVQIWRRSYDIAPPLLSKDDERHPRFNEKFKNIENLPTGESLKNVLDRLNPFWNQYSENMKENPGNHLIVAHSNSLRAIVKILDQLSDAEIVSVNIPTGVPLVYQLDEDLNVIHKEYLIDQAKLEVKQTMIANQGTVK